MQIAAMRPQYVTRDEVPADVVENERRIAEATAREEGKPEQALPKIVEGRVNGFFKDVVLLEQASVQDSKKTVKAVLDEAGVTVTRFARFEVGGTDRPLADCRSWDGVQHAQSSDEEAAIVQGSTEGTGTVAASPRPDDARRAAPYRRVVLKLSGEVFGGGKLGVDPDVVAGHRPADRRRRARPACRSRSSSAAATSSAAPSSRSAAWTAPAPTTWACSARS